MVKENRKFKSNLNIAQEKIYINTKPTKAAKNIKKKAKNASIEVMKKGRREKRLHGKYSLGTDNVDADRAGTHQWLRRSSLKGETKSFILADQSISRRAYQSIILDNGADSNCSLYTEKIFFSKSSRFFLNRKIFKLRLQICGNSRPK